MCMHMTVCVCAAETFTIQGQKLTHCLVADESGSIHMSVWNLIGALQLGDILHLKNGYCNLFRDSLILYVNRQSTLERVGL
jgi:ssDNA-binding replication factor A large subunit